MKLLPLLALGLVVSTAATAVQAADSPLYGIPLKDIDGKDTSLKTYAGKALLIVNVASQCGYTRQYTGLETLSQKHKGAGLVVLGFPCNDFGSQEPGANAEIKEFCSTRFKVSFPLFDKLAIKGPDAHPLYTALTGAQSPFPGPVKWNFSKFVINREGILTARFDSRTEPDSAELNQAIEAALK